MIEPVFQYPDLFEGSLQCGCCLVPLGHVHDHANIFRTTRYVNDRPSPSVQVPHGSVRKNESIVQCAVPSFNCHLVDRLLDPRPIPRDEPIAGTIRKTVSSWPDRGQRCEKLLATRRT